VKPNTSCRHKDETDKVFVSTPTEREVIVSKPARRWIAVAMLASTVAVAAIALYLAPDGSGAALARVPYDRRVTDTDTRSEPSAPARVRERVSTSPGALGASAEEDDESLPSVAEAFRYNYRKLVGASERDRKAALYAKATLVSELTDEERIRLRIEDLSSVDFTDTSSFQDVLYYRWLDLDRESLWRDGLRPALDELAASGAFDELWDHYAVRTMFHILLLPDEVLDWTERYLWSYDLESGGHSPEPLLRGLRLVSSRPRVRAVLLRVMGVDWLRISRKVSLCGSLVQHTPYAELAPYLDDWLGREEPRTAGSGERTAGMPWVAIEALRDYSEIRRDVVAELADVPRGDEERRRTLEAARDAAPGPGELVTKLAPLVRNASTTTVRAAIEAIAEFGDESGRQLLIDLLGDEDVDGEMILVALAGKGRIHPNDVLAWLGDERLGEVAVFVLHYLIERDPSLYHHLTDVAFGEYPNGHRLQAYLAIAHLDLERATSDLQRGLELETDPEIIGVILYALAQRGAVESLLAVANDSSTYGPEARTYAYHETLRILGKRDGIDALIPTVLSMAEDTAPFIRAQAGLMLGAFVLARDDAPAECQKAFDLWMQDPPDELLDIVGLEGPERVAASLLLGTDVGQSRIRARITDFLGDLRHPDVAHELEKTSALFALMDESGFSSGFDATRRQHDFAQLIQAIASAK
jgi:HEAT repeat protein